MLTRSLATNSHDVNWLISIQQISGGYQTYECLFCRTDNISVVMTRNWLAGTEARPRVSRPELHHSVLLRHSTWSHLPTHCWSSVSTMDMKCWKWKLYWTSASELCWKRFFGRKSLSSMWCFASHTCTKHYQIRNLGNHLLFLNVPCEELVIYIL